MYKIIPWSCDLDLNDFYATAKTRGFVNNACQKMLVDSIAKEKEWCVWILYYNDKAVGSVAAHSFPEMGDNAYRIAVRTCVFTDILDDSYANGLRTISVITKYQNPTSQFLIPTCIEWAPDGANLYITSNTRKIGTQRRVHNIFAPALEKQGVMQRIKELRYRETDQTVWQLFPDKFLEQLKKYPKW